MTQSLKLVQSPVLKEAQNFLTLLDEEAEGFTFQTFDDLKSRKNPSLTRIFHGCLEDYWDQLTNLNLQGAGVFVTVNKTDLQGRLKENIVGTRAIWQEQDRAGCPELPVEPHITVNSSPGKHHNYVLVSNAPVDEFAAVQERLVADYGSDPGAKDLCRVLRLPGFCHQKNPATPHLVRVVAQSGAPPLPWERVKSHFPPVQRQQAPPPANAQPQGHINGHELRSALSVLNADMPYPDWLAVGMALHKGFNGGAEGLTLWDNWSRAGGKYHPGECAKKWFSFDVSNGSGVSVNTLFKMANNTGWRWQERACSAIEDFAPHLAGAEWPEPEPISLVLPGVEAITPSMIPGPFRAWVTDIAERMQVPLEFLAAPLMVVCSSIIGTSCEIWPKQQDDWRIVPNLWGGIIGGPSVLKSPTLNEMVNKSLGMLEDQADKVYLQACRADVIEATVRAEKIKVLKQEINQAVRKARKSQGASSSEETQAKAEELERLKRQQEVGPPAPRRYKINDSTIEKAVELLNQNSRGLLYFRDELISLFRRTEKAGNEQDRAFLLESWNGYGTHTDDRIGRGTVKAENLCLSVLGGIQPDKIAHYIDNAINKGDNDGFIQRLQLMVYPDPVPEWKYVDRPPNKAARNRGYAVIEFLAKMDIEGEDIFEKTYLRFTPEAQGVFRRWLTVLEEQKLKNQDDHTVILEHLAKYRSLLPSLALIFHLVAAADREDSKPGSVSLEAVEMAVQWCRVLETHARRIYSLAILGQSSAAASRLGEQLKAGKLNNKFKLHEVKRKGWALLTDKQNIQEAIDYLVDFGWLREDSATRGARGGSTYRVNPKIASLE